MSDPLGGCRCRRQAVCAPSVMPKLRNQRRLSSRPPLLPLRTPVTAEARWTPRGSRRRSRLRGGLEQLSARAGWRPSSGQDPGVASGCDARRRGALRLWPSSPDRFRRACRSLARFRQALIAIEAALELVAECRASGSASACQVFVEEDARRVLVQRLRLSNVPSRRLLMLAAQAGSAAALSRGDEYAKDGTSIVRAPDPSKLALLLVWVAVGGRSGRSQLAPCVRACRMAGRRPAFPCAGPTSWRLAGWRALTLAETLRRLERDWIEGGFGLTREQLLARVAQAYRRAPAQFAVRREPLDRRRGGRRARVASPHRMK